MARSLPEVCPFLVTVDLNVEVARITPWPELPRPTLHDRSYSCPYSKIYICGEWVVYAERVTYVITRI